MESSLEISWRWERSRRILHRQELWVNSEDHESQKNIKQGRDMLGFAFARDHLGSGKNGERRRKLPEEMDRLDMDMAQMGPSGFPDK